LTNNIVPPTTSTARAPSFVMVPKAPAIHQQRDSGDARQGLLKKLQTLALELGGLEGEPGDVAPRARQVGDEAIGDGIRHRRSLPR
jgi:hypothetical protein